MRWLMHEDAEHQAHCGEESSIHTFSFWAFSSLFDRMANVKIKRQDLGEDGRVEAGTIIEFCDGLEQQAACPAMREFLL